MQKSGINFWRVYFKDISIEIKKGCAASGNLLKLMNGKVKTCRGFEYVGISTNQINI